MRIPYLTAFLMSAALFASPAVFSQSPADGSPSLLGVPEIHLTNLTPFYKWTGVVARMDADRQPLRPWLDNKKILEGLPRREMAQKVNDIINGYDYVTDIINWGVSDYWETPAEFFAHGGDCEDFVIAKYAWLRFLGVPEERLRIAIVHDRIRNIIHAVLILYINNKAVILDNEVKDIRDSNATSRYSLTYSINRLGWWKPAAPEDARVSSNHTVPFSTKHCPAGSSLPECINAMAPVAGGGSRN